MRRTQRRRRIEALRAHKLARTARRFRRASPNSPSPGGKEYTPGEFAGLLTNLAACFIHERIREMTGEVPSDPNATPLGRLAATGRRALVRAAAVERARSSWDNWDEAEVERELKAWPDEHTAGSSKP